MFTVVLPNDITRYADDKSVDKLHRQGYRPISPEICAL